MNIQLTEVLSDVMGMTGQAIIRDIVAGQRDAQALARHRSGRIKASAEEVRKALTGNWREARPLSTRGNNTTNSNSASAALQP